MGSGSDDGDEFQPKTIFGYPIDFHPQGQSFRAELPDFPDLTLPPSESKGRIIRDAWDAVLEEMGRLRAEGEDLPPTEYAGSHQEEVSRDSLVMNRRLVYLGYYASPMEITQPEMGALQSVVEDVDPTRPLSDLDQAEFYWLEHEIHDEIQAHIMSAANRAKFVQSLWMETPHLKQFSHLVEDAFVSANRGSLISTVLTLLPVFEGVLSTWWRAETGNDRHPSFNTLKNFLAERRHAVAPTMVHPIFTEEHIWALCNVLHAHVWGPMDEANLVGFLNRHYAFHLPGTGRFFRPFNTSRLILLSDLLAQVVAACCGTHGSFTYPSDEYEDRRQFYMSESGYLNDRWESYHGFLSQHECYDPE